MKILKDKGAMVDIGVALTIVMVFASLLVVGYVIYQLKVGLNPTGAAANSVNNISKGYDNAITLILVAVTVWILSLAIGALLMLRGR